MHKSELLEILQDRFEANMGRHREIKWEEVLEKLEKSPAKLKALSRMEETGGEPDVVETLSKPNEIVFVDCCTESPKERRSLCYDRDSLDSRKTFKPKTSALEMAEAMGIEILTEDEYRALQTVGKFDLKTSSWVLTPSAIRKLGGAIFCDRRYDHVFSYHNGAESYYASRGFRGKIVV